MMQAGLIDEFLDGVTTRLSDTFAWVTDPFWWHWLPIGIAVILAAVAAAWFFPVLRSLAGAIVFAVIGGLFAYRKGELDEKARRKPAPKPPARVPSDPKWNDWFNRQ